MPVYRYKFIGAALLDLSKKVPGSPSIGGIGPSTYMDVTVPVENLSDLNEYMASKGYAYDSTDPARTPMAQALSEMHPILSPTTETGTITISTSSPTVVSGLTITPVAGVYLCFFTGACWMSQPDSTHCITLQLWVDGTPIPGASVSTSNDVGYVQPFCVVGICTVDGSQAIGARWSRTTGGGTATMLGTRTLNILKIG